MLRRRTSSPLVRLARHRARTFAGVFTGVLAAALVAACSDRVPTVPGGGAARPAAAASARGRVEVTRYDAKDLAEYQQMWSNPYGRLELDAGGTMSVSGATGVTVRAEPFHVGADYSVFDHLKYIAVSNQAFAVPAHGSLTFAVQIDASTTGAVAGRVIHGCYGPPGSMDDDPARCTAPWSASTFQGQQAGVVLNMINFRTGQLFDWFVSGNEVFALIERLPSNVTGSPGVGLDKAYTQIIRTRTIAAGASHFVAITYTRTPDGSSVQYFLDGERFATVDDVGVPLDVQGVSYTGVYPSLGPGEPVANDVDVFVIGHGLFSLLDAFPFQHPDRPDLSVSVPMSERLFGQGATGSWRHFTVTRITY